MRSFFVSQANLKHLSHSEPLSVSLVLAPQTHATVLYQLRHIKSQYLCHIQVSMSQKSGAISEGDPLLGSYYKIFQALLVLKQALNSRRTSLLPGHSIKMGGLSISHRNALSSVLSDSELLLRVHIVRRTNTPGPQKLACLQQGPLPYKMWMPVS